MIPATPLPPPQEMTPAEMISEIIATNALHGYRVAISEPDMYDPALEVDVIRRDTMNEATTFRTQLVRYLLDTRSHHPSPGVFGPQSE
jgi:hypothetical protein